MQSPASSPLAGDCAFEKACSGELTRNTPDRRRLQLPFGEFAKFVGHGTRNTQRCRAVSDSIPAEAIADLIDGTISSPTCHPLLGAGAARVILKPEREFQLQIPVLLKMRHGDRQ